MTRESWPSRSRKCGGTYVRPDTAAFTRGDGGGAAAAEEVEEGKAGSATVT